MAIAVQDIADAFDKYLGRPPTAEESATYQPSSAYQLDLYLRHRPEYSASLAYRQRWGQIQQLAMDTWGHPYDGPTVDQMVRDGVQDDWIKYQWSQSPEYQALYAGKPGYMTPTEYRGKYEQYALGKNDVSRLFQDWGSQQLSDTQLQKLFFGDVNDPEANALKNQYQQYQNYEKDKQKEHPDISTIKQAPYGPEQPLMAAGTTVAPIAEAPQMQPQTQPQASSQTPRPNTPTLAGDQQQPSDVTKYASFQDYLNGQLSDAYKAQQPGYVNPLNQAVPIAQQTEAANQAVPQNKP